MVIKIARIVKFINWISNIIFFTCLVSGEIKLLDYAVNEKKNWPVDSDCESVRMISTFFETEKGYDYVELGNIKYNGTIKIDTILPTNFSVYFFSDNIFPARGFILNWSCLNQWKEWTSLDDGSCREAIGTQPPFNGADREYWTKYRKAKKPCSKLSFFLWIIIRVVQVR